MNNNSLTHFGVLGMRWGVRKATRDTKRNESLKQMTETERRTFSDIKLIKGKGYANRILDSMAKGRSLNQAVKRARRIDASINMTIVGIYYSPVIISKIKSLSTYNSGKKTTDSVLKQIGSQSFVDMMEYLPGKFQMIYD